jgi:hypothetical protein
VAQQLNTSSSRLVDGARPLSSTLRRSSQLRRTPQQGLLLTRAGRCAPVPAAEPLGVGKKPVHVERGTFDEHGWKIGSSCLLLITSSLDRKDAYLNGVTSRITPLPAPFWHRRLRRPPKKRVAAPFLLPPPTPMNSGGFPPRMAHAEYPLLPTRTTGPRGEPSPAALAARAAWPTETSHPDASPGLTKRALHKSIAGADFFRKGTCRILHRATPDGPSARRSALSRDFRYGPAARRSGLLRRYSRAYGKRWPFERRARFPLAKRAPVAPRPPQRRARPQRRAADRRCSNHLLRRSDACRRCSPRAMAHEESAPPTSTNGPRGEPSPAALAARACSASGPPARSSSTFPAKPRLFPLDKPSSPGATIAFTNTPTRHAMGQHFTSSSDEHARTDWPHRHRPLS